MRRVFDFFFLLNRLGDHELQKIISENRVDPVPAGRKMPGFKFIAFNPPPDRPRMFMEERRRFLYRHNFIHSLRT